MNKYVKSIVQIDHHRNGVGGEPFYAILFQDAEKENGLMVATVYEESGYCSVLRVADLADSDRGVTFGVNSWRGDRYEPELRQAIEAYDKKIEERFNR